MLIAIDGPAASGKGTLSRLIAAHYGLPHLDTGKLYRAVARDTLAARGKPADAGAALAAAKALDPATLDDPQLMERRLGEAASIVASHPGVREALRAYQRAFAGQARGAVIDGRDIGTVIAPEAVAKLFVDARPEVRAHRRWLELQNMGIIRDEGAVLAELNIRDAADRNRPISPLLQAVDAALLDTSDLGIDAAFAAALALVDFKVKEALAARL